MRRATAFALLLSVAAACSGKGGGTAPTFGPSDIAADEKAGCSAPAHLAIEGREHVQPPTRVQYKTSPPTSGNHYSVQGLAPAPTGTHASPVQDEAQVHNLEHGHAVIQYAPGKIDRALLDGLIALTKKNDRFVLLAPRDSFDNNAVLAFTAWGVGQWCATPNAGAVAVATKFVAAFSHHAPEEIAGTPASETPPV